MVRKRTAILICVLTGVALEVLVGGLSGRAEAWDSSLYWVAGLPMALVVAVLVGLFAEGEGWLFAALIVPAQMTAMVVRTRGGFGLWPLSLVMGFFLGAPLMIAALVANRQRAYEAKRLTIQLVDVTLLISTIDTRPAVGGSIMRPRRGGRRHGSGIGIKSRRTRIAPGRSHRRTTDR